MPTPPVRCMCVPVAQGKNTNVGQNQKRLLKLQDILSYAPSNQSPRLKLILPLSSSTTRSPGCGFGVGKGFGKEGTRGWRCLGLVVSYRYVMGKFTERWFPPAVGEFPRNVDKWATQSYLSREDVEVNDLDVQQEQPQMNVMFKSRARPTLQASTPETHCPFYCPTNSSTQARSTSERLPISHVCVDPIQEDMLPVLEEPHSNPP